MVGELVRIVWEHVGLVVEDVMLVWDNIVLVGNYVQGIWEGAGLVIWDEGYVIRDKGYKGSASSLCRNMHINVITQV